MYAMWHVPHITGPQTFPISKLGGWKDTTAFHKSSNTLDNTDVMEIGR